MGIPYGSNPATCPVRTWRAWLVLRGSAEGPAYLTIDRHERLTHRRLTTLDRLGDTREFESDHLGSHEWLADNPQL